MVYVLKKENNYCCIDNKNTVNKTQNLNKATKFGSKEQAEHMLIRACKKLKDFQVEEVNETEIVEDTEVKVKRKQFNTKERTIIYNRNKGRCAICGRFVPYDTFTVDHIIPLSKCGTNELKNLQCTCKTCNLIKQDILPEDLMDKLTEIVLYQMKRNYNGSLRKKINYIHKQRQKSKVSQIIKILKK